MSPASVCRADPLSDENPETGTHSTLSDRLSKSRLTVNRLTLK